MNLFLNRFYYNFFGSKLHWKTILSKNENNLLGHIFAKLPLEINIFNIIYQVRLKALYTTIIVLCIKKCSDK